MSLGHGTLGTELTRKSIHVAVGCGALLLRWLAPWEAALLALGAVLFNLFILHRVTRGALLRDHERARGFSWGIAVYPVLLLGLIAVFRNRLELAAGVIGLLAFGDGMAAVTGILAGGPRLPWNRHKTWAGFVAFVLWGTVASAFLLRWTQLAVIDAARRGDPAGPGWIGSTFLAAGDALISEPALLLLGCFAAAVGAAIAESADSALDDNLRLTLTGGILLWAGGLVEPSLLVRAGDTMGRALLWGLAINAVLAAGAYALRAVSVSGALCGGLLGTGLLALAGWRGFIVMGTFFVLGSAATRLGFARKNALGLAQASGGRRGAGSALANVTAGLVFAFLAASTPHAALMSVAMVAAFATAACDTVASEIGQAYGRRHYLITTLHRVRPGTDGAVSLEGTLAGWAGAAVVATTAWQCGLIEPRAMLPVVIGALAGATIESGLDALAGPRLRPGNDLANFVNTVAGALVALGLFVLLR
jgi:uncharacterized protein (TIGR00297 family)